ncbi:lipopolysaccharide biosynthesis protein [Blautia obeum]|uniref:Uncharacterized protein n=1 Tax=Blautia obeum TaxID=40520 RepID=A0A411ZK48_9FIRM|nr:oligosaccharide flippase family protein [Blautia obeum]RGQ03169.1 hypothetical protein DWZ12_13420 [Blautia obeum]
MSNEIKKYTHLLKNTAVFGVGTFGSKVLQFLIVPLYTYILTTEEYGKIDVFATTISLALPFVTLLVQEAIIRFLTTKEISDKEAVNSGMIVFFTSIILGALITPLYAFVFEKEYAMLFFICLILNSFVAIFQNYLKACGKVLDFTFCGLINTFSFLITNVLMLAVFKLGIMGYLYSMIISQIFSGIYILVRGEIICKISLTKNDFSVIKSMLVFSVPLIPNNLMWWIMNAGDKYIINYFLGDSYNGLYSISIKLATIVTTVFSIFMQAWQLSAIEENGSKEQARFYSKVYSNMMALLLGSAATILMFNRPIFCSFIGKNFFDAHLYSPLLCVATVISCMSTFFGVTYLVSKSTSKAFTTTVVGATINIIVNFLLIRPLGLTGVALGTIIGYAVVMLIRIRDTAEHISMNFDAIRTTIGLMLVFGGSIIYMFIPNSFSVILGFACVCIIAIVYHHEIRNILRIINDRLKNRKK